MEPTWNGIKDFRVAVPFAFGKSDDEMSSDVVCLRYGGWALANDSKCVTPDGPVPLTALEIPALISTRENAEEIARIIKDAGHGEFQVTLWIRRDWYEYRNGIKVLAADYGHSQEYANAYEEERMSDKYRLPSGNYRRGSRGGRSRVYRRPA